MNLKTLGLAFLDLVFPPREACPFCGGNSTGAQVCADCRRTMEGYLREPFCSVCGRYFTGSGRHMHICKDCRETPRPFLLARAAGPYEGLLKDAVHGLKFHNKRGLASHLAAGMVAAARAETGFNRVSAVVPVPMSPGRLRERGFNQADLLAGEVSATLGLPLLKAVRKIKETPAQTGIGRRQRQKNLQGAFDVPDRSSVHGRVLLVVDDVITTAGTLEAVAGILLAAGASLVLGLAAASGRTGL